MNWLKRLAAPTEPEPDPFERVHDVLQGRKRIELDEVSRKVLWILLGFEGGCDLVITTHTFEAMAAEGLNPGFYNFAAAPAVVSELLVMAGVELMEMSGVLLPVKEVRAFVGPGVTAPGVGFGRKVFWLDASREQVVMRLRPASGDDERDLAEAPEPIPGLIVPAGCPYCGQALRTVKAKQCRFCKRDWHDPENVKRLDGSPADP